MTLTSDIAASPSPSSKAVNRKGWRLFSDSTLVLSALRCDNARDANLTDEGARRGTRTRTDP
jgi:hypothetical protein